MQKKKKNAKGSVLPEPQARQENESPHQDPKEAESPNEASDHGNVHANEPAALKKATSARIPCYIACATSVQRLCDLCKHPLPRGCTHLHTGGTSHLHRTWRGNGPRRPQTNVRRRATTLAFLPVVVYDGACWKGRMGATDSPSSAKANLKKATTNRRKANSGSASHGNGKMMRRWRQTSCGPYASSREGPHLPKKTTRCKRSKR